MVKKPKAFTEDAIGIYENKFELIAIAARRARDLRDGRKPLVEKDSDKEPVIALKEILSGRLQVEIVRENEDNNSEG
jgi:DNA-directed RNA polymerase subunit omega